MECRDRELEKKEKELDELRRRIKSREMEIECRNREKELKGLRKKIQMREQEVKCKDREFGARCWEYKANLVKLEQRLQDVERREGENGIWYNEQFELSGIGKEEVEEKIGNALLDDEKLKERCGEIESRERKLDERVEEVDLKEKRLEQLAEKLKCIERELEDRVKEANLKERGLQERLDGFALEKREFDKRFKEGIVWERRLLEGIKELEIREEQLQDRNREIDVAKNSLNMALLATLRSGEPCNHGVATAAGVVVQNCIVMDGRALQILLNECWKDHDKIRDTVSALLIYCSDPAKLVLDALVGFYPPHLKLRDSAFEVSVVRNSCLLLLEQLMEIGPNIKPHVKSEAMKLSFEWITQMKLDSEHSMEVVAFLELVSAYGLADAFDANELLDYAETVAHHKQIPRLCQALGLAGKIPGLINTLLKRERYLIALGFIIEFDLVDEFPPASLLDDFIKLSENAAEVIIREGNNSIEAQNQAMTKRVAMLKDAIECIKYLDIRSGFSAGSIEQMIDSLKQKESLDKAIAHISIGLQTRESNHSIDAASDLADISASAGSAPCTDVAEIAAPPLTVSIQQQEDILMDALPNPNVDASSLEHPTQAEPTADKGSPSSKPQQLSIKVEGLRTLLGESVAYESVRDEILCVLKSASDPAHLVLDAMKHESSNLRGISVEGCILLLEDVRKLSPVIEFLVEAEARQYAKDWILKLELKKDVHVEVICLMQFLLVYNLCCDFDEWEVYGLLDPSCWLNEFTDSCRLLGLSDLLPNFVENLIANKCLLRAIAYICTFKLDDKFPLESLLNNYVMNAMKEADIMCEEENASPMDQIMAMNCKISSVRTAIKYIHRYGIGSKDMHVCLQDDVEQLEKLKTEKTRKLDVGSNSCVRKDDVKELRMLLSGDTAYKLVEDGISRVLKSSPEPEYLVLNAIKNVDTPHLDGYIHFEGGIPINNCILLLEQLQSISPKIKCQARDEAECLMKKLIKKLKRTKDDHMGVLYFIMLHKVYNQSVKLNPADVIGLLNPSSWKQVSESCHKLGLKDVYPEALIRTMIANKQGIKLIKAIKYILHFRLDDKFSIANLLKDYLFHSRRKADNMCRDKKRSPEVQIEAIRMKIDFARIVVRCIQEHKLHSIYPVKPLEDEIQQLCKQKEKACQQNGSSSGGLKRNRKQKDAEDEEFRPDIFTYETPRRKKNKKNALGKSQQCSVSYNAMQPPPPHPLPPPSLPPPSSTLPFTSLPPPTSLPLPPH